MSEQERTYRRLGETTKFGLDALKPIRRGDIRCKPMFLFIKGSQKGRPLPLPEGHWTLGRGSQSDFSVLGRGISRLHLKIESSADGIVRVTDTSSTNGIQVNSQLVTMHTFSAGDILQIGPEVALKFALAPACELDVQVRLYDQSILDELTGLYNRRHLLNVLRPSLAYSHRHRKPLCLLMVDIDHFKAVNDTHGHHTGDSILREFAALLMSTLREEDVCARIGGEEFALLLHGMEHDNCLEAAERIRILIASHAFASDELRIGCTTSIGGAMVPSGEKISPAALLKLADAKLYQAKNNGRNCTIF